RHAARTGPTRRRTTGPDRRTAECGDRDASAGRQRAVIELRNGASVAAIAVERGGRLASLVVGGRDLIVGPPDDGDRTILWGSFLMAPWCGRIEGGVLEWDGGTHQLPRNLEGNAIHGVLWDQAWTVEAVRD